MPKIEWDKTGERYFEAGVSKGVLYTKKLKDYDSASPWNGLISITEKPTGAEANDMYADGIKYASLRSAETFEASMEAYTYPKAFEACDGSAEMLPGVMVGQQNRKSFGLCYRTEIGNDQSESVDLGYKLHLVYGCSASVSERQYQTLNDNPEAITFSWDLKTTPVNVTGMKATSLVTIDSTLVNADKMKKIEDILYGTEAQEARLPLPDEVKSILTES